MDTPDGFDEARSVSDPTDAGVGETTAAIGTDERRMHVRAYTHWVSLLKGRPYPAIGNLDPEGIADFGPYSVLLDFSAGIENPAIRFLGRALREECGLEHSISTIAEVPARSLLSRLTDHYLQIIANRAPIGFEAEFVGTRGHTTFYRGILMPFSSDADTIDYIYGVINWKEVVQPAEQAMIESELARELANPVARCGTEAPVWADGPGSRGAATPSLGDQLALARESAAVARAADTRTRAALYRALGRAHDFAIAAQGNPAERDDLLRQAGLRIQTRAPMTGIVKLVFGPDYDKTRVTEYATVLDHARRMDIPAQGLGAMLDATPGGIKAIVASERAARRPRHQQRAPITVGQRPAVARVTLPASIAADDVIVLVARGCAGGTGEVEIVGHVSTAALVDRVIRALD